MTHIFRFYCCIKMPQLSSPYCRINSMQLYKFTTWVSA